MIPAPPDRPSNSQRSAPPLYTHPSKDHSVWQLSSKRPRPTHTTCTRIGTAAPRYLHSAATLHRSRSRRYIHDSAQLLDAKPLSAAAAVVFVSLKEQGKQRGCTDLSFQHPRWSETGALVHPITAKALTSLNAEGHTGGGGGSSATPPPQSRGAALAPAAAAAAAAARRCDSQPAGFSLQPGFAVRIAQRV
jgi:hypothetical protein